MKLMRLSAYLAEFVNDSCYQTINKFGRLDSWIQFDCFDKDILIWQYDMIVYDISINNKK